MTVVSSNTPNNDAFDAAFAQHSALVTEGNVPLGVETPAADPAAPAPDPAAPAPDPAAPAPDPAAPAPAPDPAAPAPDPAAPAPAPAPDPAAPAPAPAAANPELADQFKQLLASMAPPAAKEVPAPSPAPVAVQEQPVYSHEELAQITEYEKNWPDVAAAEALRRRGEYAQMLNYVFGQVAQYMTPVMTDMQKLMNDAHMGQLRERVPDYTPTLEADVISWVGKQPAYLQTAYQQVMQNGTSEEVADLIGRYRTAEGVAPAPAPAPTAVVPATPPAAPARKTELSEAAKQAAKSLAPVGSERTAVVSGQDPGDFDSAFARFAAEAKD